MKMKELCNEWLTKYVKYRVKPQTKMRYDCAINNHINPCLGNYNVNKINKRTIQDFINELRDYKSYKTMKKLSNSTINLTILILKMIFNYAVDFEILKFSPMSKVKSLERIKPDRAKFFNIEEQIKIEEYVKKQDDEYLGILLDLYTGLRIGELMALKWEDVDYKNNVIHINKTVYEVVNDQGIWYERVGTPKSKTSTRDIPISEYVSGILSDLYRSNNIYVVSDRRGRSIPSKLYRSKYNSMLKKLGIRHLPFHTLRHTFATRAIESGMDVKSLSEILGHSDAAMTLNIYAHSTIEHKRLMMEKMHPVYDQI